MSVKYLRKCCALAIVVYILLAILFFWISGEQLYFRVDETIGVSPAQPIGELVQGVEIRQPFLADGEEILSVKMFLATYSRENTSHFVVGILDSAGAVLGEAACSGEGLEDNSDCEIYFPEPVPVVPGERYTLLLTSPDGVPGNAVTAWFGTTVPASRAEIAVVIPAEEQMAVNGQNWECRLQFSLRTRTHLWFGGVYWYLVAAAGLRMTGYCLWLLQAIKKGKSPLLLRVADALKNYNYLMRQLIARDFKTKYKRSMLGILWSFLNPLLTMAVQYIVFSTLFKSDIKNFPLYLLTGIVCFNFFSEAAGMALLSIVGNAALITKVYVPKYIYPVSRVLSSSVNLLLSLIPLFLIMLFTRTSFRPAMLLLPFGLVCLVAFCIGVGFILSTSMVFFRDTQFLWGVISMLWMYMTPIFYPDSIIPQQFMVIYKCNPLYHIIRFFRIILMNGVSPEPKAYGLCFIASFVPLLLGAWIFKKNQDKFILNL